MLNQNLETYDMVTVKRPCDEDPFEALIVGSCDTGEIFTLLVWTDNTHPLGEGWCTRYAARNSILKVEA